MTGGLGSLDRLRLVGMTFVVLGAVGSVALMFMVGRRQPSILLLLLFAGWVLLPFLGLGHADAASPRWSAISRTALHVLMIVVSLGSLALYADVLLRPPRSAPASRFLLVPAGSWLLMAIVLKTAAGISRRRPDPSSKTETP